MESLLSTLSTIFYFIVTIFILVTVHEFGHFIAGRIFGMHVPIFSVGMGRRLFGYNKREGFTFGPMPEEEENKLGKDTDYRLSLLPIGGYAKIDGMIDETQTEALPPEPQPWEFRAKPWWQKSIVITAGVIMNVISAIIIFGLVKYSQGKEVHNTTKVGYVINNSIAAKAGVMPGDKVVAIDGRPIANWDELLEAVYLEKMANDFILTMDRGGSRFNVPYKASELGNLTGDQLEMQRKFGLVVEGFGMAKIATVVASDPADKAGVESGDTILAINGVATPNDQAVIDNIKPNAGKEITLLLRRNGQEIEKKVTPNAEGRIGISPVSTYNGPILKEEYAFTSFLSLGWTEFRRQTALFLKGMGMMFSGEVEVRKSVGGPIKIAEFASKSAEGGVASFFMFMGMLSISLAFLNILPIPALDGGHLVIILVEAVLGRELSQGFKMGFQKVGVVLLLSLMVFMVFNDLSSKFM